MWADDKLVADTEEKKNELETYIYDLRNKLDDKYAEFASEEEKEKIREKLAVTEVSSGSINSVTRWQLTLFAGLALR